MSGSDKLNSRETGLRIATIDENNVQLRYNNPKIKIYMVKNPLNKMFFNYHCNLMQKAKVFKRKD